MTSAEEVVARLDGLLSSGARGAVRPAVRGGSPVLDVALPGAFHAVFSTRWRGSSDGLVPLDLRAFGNGRPCGQDDEHLLASIRPTAPSTGLVSPRQVHGLNVYGAAEYLAGEAGSGCDGLVVNPVADAGLTAFLRFADCLPVLLVSEVDAALVHAGWRGLLSGVLTGGAEAMTAPPRMAVLGPSIGPCCYEVSPELAARFVDRFGPEVVRDEVSVPVGRRPHLDLWLSARAALAELGVARVVDPRLCTACHLDVFYSYRVEGPATGRHAALLWAEGDRPKEGE